MSAVCNCSMIVYENFQVFNWSAFFWGLLVAIKYTHRIHGAGIYGNMDPNNIPQSCYLAGIYTNTMDPVGYKLIKH